MENELQDIHYLEDYTLEIKNKNWVLKGLPTGELNLFSEKPRLPFYGIYPAVIEQLPQAYKSKFEKDLVQGDLLIQTEKYWVFWFNTNVDNMAEIEEIAFKTREAASTLQEVYIWYNSQVVDRIIEASKQAFNSIQK